MEMSNRRDNGSYRRDPRGRDKIRQGPPKRYEDFAWQLDYLPRGHVDDPRPKHLRDPVLQVIGEKYFSLLEVLMERPLGDDFEFHIGSRIFIGKGEENTIGHRFKRIKYDQLTMNAKGELPGVLQKIIDDNPSRFLDFFNKSQPITNRMHQLELLPGIGKKTMWQIIEARKRKNFETFNDLQDRTSISQPDTLIVKRIMKELDGAGEKHLIFVRP